MQSRSFQLASKEAQKFFPRHSEVFCRLMMITLNKLSNQRPFIFFSAVLLIYTILQLLISYHIIETEFASSHTAHHVGITFDRKTVSLNTDSEYETNRFEGCDPIKIDYEWGKQFENQKIACMVLSLYPRNKLLMAIATETYGKLCDGLFFILDDGKEHWFNKSVHTEQNKQFKHIDPQFFESNQKLIENEYFGEGTIIRLNLCRPSHHTQRNTWEKVHRMYTYFYVHYLYDYDWFVRLDDDVLVSMINLREYLSYFRADGDVPYYVGHTLLDRFRKDNIVYNAGNLHVINRKALSMIGPLFMTFPSSQSPHAAGAHCMDFVAGNDDPHLGSCLNAMGIYPLNTLDYELKNRFMVFTYKDHHNIKREDSWYWKERPLDMGSMQECCNVFVMNDHPWIHIAGHLEWRRKWIAESESTWNNQTYIDELKHKMMNEGKGKEVIPPRPCTFMFSTKGEFTVDKYYNVDSEQIPRGQRISFGNDEVLKCHKCKIGDESDIYWNNELDRTGLIYKINDENKHKFLQIMKYFPNQLISTQFVIDPETKKFVSEEEGDEAARLQALIDQALDSKVSEIKL